VSTSDKTTDMSSVGTTVFRTNSYYDFIGDKNQDVYRKMNRADIRLDSSYKTGNSFICFFFNEESISQYYLVL